MTNQRIRHLGFTLIELMIAVVVLLGVMVAVGRIFSTTSDVSASGKAISETLQQAVAIEQQLRKDIAKMSREGFLGIRSVALANNMRGNFWLIDDSLPPNAIIRCDQLIFFTDGLASPMLNAVTTDFAGQGLASMIYYGHGIRLEQLEGMNEGTNNFDESDDPIYFGSTILTPWYEGAIDVEARYYTDSQNPDGPAERFVIVEGSQYTANGTQGDPSNWTLCRQAVVLVDDDDNAPGDIGNTNYLGKGISTHTIFPWDPRIGGANVYPHVLHGRVDIAATQLDDIRQSVLQDNGGVNNREWRVEGNPALDQQELIATLFYWPRVEPFPPTTIRYDQAMMMSALVEGCVSFQIEWTYDEGVGEATDAYGNWFTGYYYDNAATQPWWGGSWRVDPEDDDNLQIGFDTLVDFTTDANAGDTNHTPAVSMDPRLIEPIFQPNDGTSVVRVPTVQNTVGGVSEYWAIFGYNGHDPFYENDIDLLNEDISENIAVDFGNIIDGNSTWRYTPIPSALRITIRIVDRDNRLGAGWTYQFVVDLPERK